MKQEKRFKMAVISGAAHALKYKQEHPRSSDEEAIRHVSREMESILQKIEQED